MFLFIFSHFLTVSFVHRIVLNFRKKGLVLSFVSGQKIVLCFYFPIQAPSAMRKKRILYSP